MNEINDGGPAMPCGQIRRSRPAHDPGADFREVDRVSPLHNGMSLRDYFAAKAMQAWLSGHVAHYGHENFWDPEKLASSAWEFADAMLASREVKP